MASVKFMASQGGTVFRYKNTRITGRKPRTTNLYHLILCVLLLLCMTWIYI